MDALSASRRDGERLFRTLGALVLRGAFGLGLLIVIWVTWSLADFALFLPVVLVAPVLAWLLFRRPLVNLCVLLAAFILIADFEEGISPQEVFFGLYFLGFLGHWYFTRLFLYRENPFVRREERTLIIFLVLISLSFPLTILFAGSMREYMSEWLSLALLGLYFPIKEAIERDRRALPAILGSLGLVGFFVLVRNVLKFRTIITDADYAFEVAFGRAVTNETLLLVPAVIALAFALSARGWMLRFVFSSLFLMFFGGVLLTQSRGYWVAFLFGALIMLLILPPRKKLTLASIGGVTIAGALGVGLILFGDVVFLMVYGLIERFQSIFTAGSQDISLVNRYYEFLGVWQSVKVNPILGYGLGVPYEVFDLIEDETLAKTFIHNGYIALWYKFGLWGMGMVVFFLGSIVRRGFLAFRSESTEGVYRWAALGAMISFCALFVSAITSNPFYGNDTMFAYGVLAGIIGGCYSRAR